MSSSQFQVNPSSSSPIAGGRLETKLEQTTSPSQFPPGYEIRLQEVLKSLSGVLDKLQGQLHSNNDHSYCKAIDAAKAILLQFSNPQVSGAVKESISDQLCSLAAQLEKNTRMLLWAANLFLLTNKLRGTPYQSLRTTITSLYGCLRCSIKANDTLGYNRLNHLVFLHEVLNTSRDSTLESLIFERNREILMLADSKPVYDQVLSCLIQFTVNYCNTAIDNATSGKAINELVWCFSEANPRKKALTESGFRRLFKIIKEKPQGYQLIASVLSQIDIFTIYKKFNSALVHYQNLLAAVPGNLPLNLIGLKAKIQARIDYCKMELDLKAKPEEKLEEGLVEKRTAPNYIKVECDAAYESRYKKYMSEHSRLPSRFIPQCSPDQLYDISLFHFNRYAFDIKSTLYNTLNMTDGAGGFEPYRRLQEVFENRLGMKSYDSADICDKELTVMRRYLKDRGIVHSTVSLLRSNIIPAQGSTQLYALFVEKMFADFANTAGKNVILVPTPTYGLFVPQVYQAGGEVQTIPLLASNQYKLSAAQLNGAIVDTNQNLFVNSLSTLRIRYQEFIQNAQKAGIDVTQLPPALKEEKGDRDELNLELENIKQKTIELANQHPMLKYKMDTFGISAIPLPPTVPQVLAFFHCNVHAPTGLIYSPDEVASLDKVRRKHGLIVIEDLSHYELTYPHAGKLGFFGKVEGVRPYKQATLLSISKAYCAAGWRLGVGYFSSDLVEDQNHVQPVSAKMRSRHKSLLQHFFDQHVFMNPYQQAAINVAFCLNDSGKDDYIKGNNEEYYFRLQLFQALLCGLGSVADMDMRFKILDLVAKDYSQAIKLLARGVPQLKLLTIPQGSFFALVDFSQYQNKYLGTHKLEAGLDFAETLLNTMSLEGITAEGMITTLPIIRFSLSRKREDIVESVIRLSTFVKLISNQSSASPQAPVPGATCSKNGIFKPGLALVVVPLVQKEISKLEAGSNAISDLQGVSLFNGLNLDDKEGMQHDSIEYVQKLFTDQSLM